MELKLEDLTVLPSNWQYEIMNVQFFGQESCYTEIRLKVALFTPEDVKSWVETLELNSSCTYSIRTTIRSAGEKVVFKQKLRCRHHTRSKKIFEPNKKCRTKNTNCPSSLNITIQAIKKKFRGNPDKAPDPAMPCLIEFVSTHNHEISIGVKSNRVSSAVKEKLMELYGMGHTPISAMEHIKSEILLSNGNYSDILEDRRFCPNYHYCYYLYTTEFKKSLMNVTDKNKETILIIENFENEMVTNTENIIIINEYKAEVAQESVVVQELIVQPEESPEIEEQILIDKGTDVIQRISDHLQNRLNESPADVLPALEEFLSRTKKMKLNTFVNSCSTFGTESRKRAKTEKLLLAVTEDFRLADT